MEEYEVINITISDGTEREFAIVDRFEVDDRRYIAVSLVEGDEIKEDIFIYACVDEGEEIEVSTIDDEDEYAKVVEEYTKIMSE